MQATRVLLVEDERIVAFHLKRQLGKLGYEVAASVASGPEALEQIALLRPDVVLMDIRISGPIDGIETTSRIDPKLQIPVIYLTAHADETMLDRARGTNPYGYLLKPFSEAELHATIQMALSRSAADATLRDSEKRLDQLLTVRSEELDRQINERLKTEEALRQAQKLEAIGQLTSGIAHDFNNLLTVIVGGLTLLERRITDNANARLVTAALEAALRGANLTRQLLSFGRRQMVQPEDLNVHKTIRKCNDLIRNAVGPLVQVEYRLGATGAVCCIDREEFERVMLNLAVNARQAMQAGGTLTIETNTVRIEADSGCETLTAGDYVRIAVRDTGHGMTAAVAAQAFDPFFTTKNIGEGSGLGLSQAYGFVRQSSGHAIIESVVNEGTSVILFLPLAAVNDAGPEVAAKPHVAVDPSFDQLPGTQFTMV